ncbi:terminase small subunit [Achromobacter phage 83-24]|uniref:Terminase small subunit n=1 Tax=Achromobacter phage 83-24 TaxID=1589747 RepID=A0A0B5A1T2_9CAUD|nr:terminase small subunit [Achromobacter phage 83-24]AJD82838.1 hypothetical protein JWAP_00005 [Achromobacter phage 83-24]
MSYTYEDDEEETPHVHQPEPPKPEPEPEARPFEDSFLLRQQKELFLDNLAMNGNVTLAARAAGWKYPTVAERYRAEDEHFAEAWVDALTQATDAMEYEARRRAMEGWDEPVWYMGEQVGSVRKYSDRLLEMMLKAHRPGRFREVQQAENTTPGVLVITQPQGQTAVEWEKHAAPQQKHLLERTV